MILAVICCGLLGYFLWEWLRDDYPGKDKRGTFFYTKKWMFRLMMALNSRKSRIIEKNNDSQTGRWDRGHGRSLTDRLMLERCQPLEENETFAIDTTYFNGFAEDETFVALRIARKHNREGELWVMLNIPGVGFFQHPIHPDTSVYNMGVNEYRALGCKFQMLEPMRRWKVTYNGLLRQGLCRDFANKPDRYVTVSLSFTWECYNDPFDFDVDADKSLLADAVAKQKWTREFWSKVRGKHQTHYAQCGELSGTIKIEGHPDRHVYLKGFREHTFGVRDWTMFYRYAVHYIRVPETGLMAMVSVLWMPDYITFLKTGYLTYATGETYPVTAVEMDVQSITQDRYPAEQYSFIFHADDVKYHVDLEAVMTPEVYHYPHRTSRVLERSCTYTVNGRPGLGLTEYHYRNHDGPAIECLPPETLPLLAEPAPYDMVDDKEKITLAFHKRSCCSTLLVGGKGSQLALLTSVQDKTGVRVPPGFCVTLAAFNLQLKEDEALEGSIERIVCSIREQKHDDVETLCSSTVRLFANCKLLKSIEEDVERQLQAIFGDSFRDVSLAVRSSAADEDGNEISSAGQMETFLGVRGLDKIPEAVRKCWASAFTYQAVEYRRQHGQSIRPSVGVVIQEMVQSDTAGVMFTNDPVTGNVNTMVIDASFGLGESIVSGQASPDTVIIRRYFDGTVEIQERSLGHKNIRIDVADAGGICRLETDSMIQQCCISDEQILQLCRIAIKVEDYFGSSRDIEWSIKGNTVYLLQARPITTTAHETDDSFIHEFDSPSATDRQYVTTANVGEMLPGCVTPLTGSVFQTATDWACRVFAGEIVGGIRKNFTTRKMLLSNCGRLFVNSTYSSSVNSNNPLFDKEGLEINFYGEIVSEHTMEIIKSYGHINKSKLSNWYNLVKFVFNTNLHGCPMVDYWYDKLLTYEIGSHCQTAEDLYTEIDRKFPDYKEAWLATLHTTGKSIFWTSLAIGVISKGEKVYNPDFYSDIALLLAQCKDVFSAEVPTDLQKIASKIAEYGIDEDFLNKTDKECVVYLTSSTCNDELKQAYKTFMDRHGHRCVREAELIEKSWRAEPETLIKALKAILKSKSYKVSNKNNPSLDESLDQMKTPVSKIGKFFLKKLIIPHARDAVGRREYGKSVAIDMCDKFKQAYWRLADMLVKECRIPDRELMFFLTHTEIGQLLDTRSANLITRAKRRRKVLPMQSEIEFPKLNVGRPQPISSEMVCDQRKASFTVHGVPVSHGLIQGTARVVRTLEEADAIQKGDILIVPYTDVGWSPYFPLITGLLTEMGGLCSHGAVVAREYGLPCLVNIPRATKLFQSGDLIRLNGTTGLVEKLEHSTNQI